MSRKILVQCAGSGKSANAGVNAKRAVCPNCHRERDLANNGNFRRHDAWRVKKTRG